MLLYYITDRAQFSGDENARQRALLRKIEDAVRCGVDYIQLREKDLPTRQLEALARAVVGIVRPAGIQATTRLLINSRTDVAIACGADGVHLRSNDIRPSDVRNIWAGRSRTVVVGLSCHSVGEVDYAASEGADFAVFAPIFEKKDAPRMNPGGLDRLRDACRRKIPVLALGGITLTNARACVESGAAGVAAIRLFQENDIAEVVRSLRG